MRRWFVTLWMIALTAVVVGTAQAGSLPARIALPDGFQPEGIAIEGGQFYVGSIPTGAIYRGDVKSGEGSVLVPGRAGRAAIGIDVHKNLIFAAGGSTGKAFVYDAETGADVAELALTSADTFVNDVVVTKDAAWFTDSLNQVLYRAALAADGKPTGQAGVQTVPLTGDIRFQEGFNTNGIDATPNGKRLVIVQTNTGQLFTVDPASGSTLEIDLGGDSVMNGDGVLLAGRRLYVVQNQQNTIAVIRLKGNLTSGRVVRRITSPDFDVPTTIARQGRWLYAVNARFGTEPTPETEYWITRVPR